MKAATAGGVIAGGAVGFAAINVSQAKEWIDVLNTIAGSPSSVVLIVLLFLLLVIFLLVEQWRSHNECKKETAKLREALRMIHVLLQTDPRYEGIPDFDAMLDGDFDIRALARDRIEPIRPVRPAMRR